MNWAPIKAPQQTAPTAASACSGLIATLARSMPLISPPPSRASRLRIAEAATIGSEAIAVSVGSARANPWEAPRPIRRPAYGGPAARFAAHFAQLSAAARTDPDPGASPPEHTHAFAIIARRSGREQPLGVGNSQAMESGTT